MNKMVGFSIGIVFCFMFLAGCASIVSESEYPVSISSQPEGAEISIKNRSGKQIYSGKTPTSITLKAGAGFFKGEKYTVSFKKDGYAPHTAQVERGVDGWYIAGNFVFGGLIGWLIVDPATGAMWTLENLHVDLNSTEKSSTKNKVQILTLDNVPKNLRSRMVRVN